MFGFQWLNDSKPPPPHPTVLAQPTTKLVLTIELLLSGDLALITKVNFKIS